MMLSCPDWASCFKYIMDSQLVSTLIALVGGSIIIEKINFKRYSERDMVKLLLSKIEKYDEMACSYWGTFSEEGSGRLGRDTRDELAARLKAEYPFLVLSVDGIKLINEKKQIKESLQELYDAATDSDFEVSRKFTNDEVRRTLVRIAKASAKVKRGLYNEMMR